MDEFVRQTKRPKINFDSDSKEIPGTSDATANSGFSSQPFRKLDGNESGGSQLPGPPKGKRTPKFAIPIPKTRKQWIIASAVISLLIGASAFAIYWFIFRDNSPAPVAKVEITEPAPDPGPQPIISPTSGREVAAEINQRPIYAVQIENSPEARPQSGLRDADIVSEAIAEGGITRFNAIFHDNVPANIGPVRSLRPYYIDWFMPYDAAIAHAGGSGEALNDVKTLGLKDIDHGNSSSVFRRVSSRYAPHNLFSTGQQMLDLMAQRGYKPSDVKSLSRKRAEPAATPNAKNISLNMSRALYNVNFVYDPATGTYLRSQGGGAHVDAETKQQISPNVVVVPIVARSTHPDRVHTVYGTVGSGKLYVFQDGTVTEGTWNKSARNAQWELKDSNGKTIELNPGQTWFTMIESADRVSFAP